jgi:5-formyltetrahydrofolate cyclo-ligase
MNKKELRSVYLEKRLLLTDAEYNRRNHQIVDNFFTNIKFDKIKVIHIFIPMLKYKEFNTWLIIEQVKKEMPSIRFSIPKVNAKIQLLENYYFESKDQLNENEWGIQEPLFGDITMAEEIDLVIVPLLAFDKSGHRVGYGKGYYDKLLSTCRPNALKIGVSLFQPVENIEDTNNLDVALDFCVTPEKIISFN